MRSVISFDCASSLKISLSVMSVVLLPRRGQAGARRQSIVYIFRHSTRTRTSFTIAALRTEPAPLRMSQSIYSRYWRTIPIQSVSPPASRRARHSNPRLITELQASPTSEIAIINAMSDCEPRPKPSQTCRRSGDFRSLDIFCALRRWVTSAASGARLSASRIGSR